MRYRKAIYLPMRVGTLSGGGASWGNVDRFGVVVNSDNCLDVERGVLLDLTLALPPTLHTACQ